MFDPGNYHQQGGLWLPPHVKPGQTGKTPQGPKRKTKSRRRIAGAVGTTLVAVLVCVLGVYLTFRLAGPQAVAGQVAVQQHDRDVDSRTAPVAIEDIDGPHFTVEAASPAVVDLDNRPAPTDFDGSSRLLPNAVPLGMLMHDKVNPSIPAVGAKGRLSFTLRGLQTSTVRISDIKAVVTRRSPSPNGTLIFFPPQGDVPNLKFGFDLDSPDKSARTVDSREDLTDTDYFKEHTVTLQRNESLGFTTIVVLTTGSACEYHLEVHFSDGRTVNIDNHGQPFFLAGYRNDYTRIYSPHHPEGLASGQALTRCDSLDACRRNAYG